MSYRWQEIQTVNRTLEIIVKIVIVDSTTIPQKAYARESILCVKHQTQSLEDALLAILDINSILRMAIVKFSSEILIVKTLTPKEIVKNVPINFMLGHKESA